MLRSRVEKESRKVSILVARPGGVKRDKEVDERREEEREWPV
jgi:hypothetical protein